MYCMHCGKQVDINSTFCPECGQRLKEEKKHCQNCGGIIEEGMLHCPYCGFSIKPQYQKPFSSKSKMAAGLLAIFLGTLGIHNFYLGNTSKGVLQIALTFGGFLTCGLTSISCGIWALVEGIMILSGSINEDADGNPLRD